MKHEVSSAVIRFKDGSYVEWKYIGKRLRLYTPTKIWAVTIRVEQSPLSLDAFLETWDKPSMHTALHLIRNTVKSGKEAFKKPG